MQHMCRVEVLETKCFPELQERYLADPKSGPCPCFATGQVFEFHRTPERDDFYHLGVARARTAATSPAARRGTASAAMCTRRCRAAPSCTAGPTTSA